MVALGEGASNNDGNVERAVALDCAYADGTTRNSPTSPNSLNENLITRTLQNQLLAYFFLFALVQALEKVRALVHFLAPTP